MKNPGKEQKIVFGVAESGDGSVTLVLGISKAAFEYSLSGDCHDFDLSSIGLGLKMVIFSGETYDSCKAAIETTMARAGVPVIDETRRDFGMKS